MARDTRDALVDAVFDVLDAHKPTLIMVAISKRKLAEKYSRPDPVEDIAYQFMLERFNNSVGRRDNPLGLVVCDEQKELQGSVRKAHARYRRHGTNMQPINNVIETPFFTPSHCSRMLQMIDVVTYWVAKYLRAQLDGAPSPKYWNRILPHLDGYPDYSGRGLKVFP